MDGRPVPDFKTATPSFFFWCVVLFSLWYVFFCWVYFPKSLQRLNSRDQFFHSIRGLVMVFLGEFTLMNPPKVMGVFRASKGGWTHKIFLMVSYGFSQALFFFIRWIPVTETPTSRKANLPNLGGGE